MRVVGFRYVFTVAVEAVCDSLIIAESECESVAVTNGASPPMCVYSQNEIESSQDLGRNNALLLFRNINVYINDFCLNEMIYLLLFRK